MKQRLQSALARLGVRVERMSTEERRLRWGYDPSHGPSLEDRTTLSPTNARLVQLELWYAEDQTPLAARSLWTTAQVQADGELQYFRGDNLYLWQYTRSPAVNRLRMLLYAKYLQGIDGRGLLQSLGEDGAFGCFTAEIDNMPVVSRDLLDSVGEICFLDRHLGLFERPGLKILDIGAGYGRLAHRMLTAVPTIAKYYCVDAVARSTFLCEYYVQYRGLQGQASVIPLPEIPDTFASGQLDIAINIHSFSEMPLSAVRGWLKLLAGLVVPRLMIVPNDESGLFSREVDGSRLNCAPALMEAGYGLIVSEWTIDDPSVRDVLDVHDRFFLYELQPTE